MSRARNTAKLLTVMPRMPDHLEAKLYELLQAHQLGHVYLTGPGQTHRNCQALDKLHDIGMVDRQLSSRAGVARWRITTAGRAYFDRNEDHRNTRARYQPRTVMLLARVKASKDLGQVFTTSPGSYYEEEMVALKARGFLKSRFLVRGKKAGRMSWTLTEEGEVWLERFVALQ